MSKKIKMTDGVLCRDKKRAGGDIVFFPELERKDVMTEEGYWCARDDCEFPRIFSPKDWEKNYDLKPPRYGTAFEASVQL